MLSALQTELRPNSLDFPSLICVEKGTGREMVKETERVLEERILGERVFYAIDPNSGKPQLQTVQCIEKTIETEVLKMCI